MHIRIASCEFQNMSTVDNICLQGIMQHGSGFQVASGFVDDDDMKD